MLVKPVPHTSINVELVSYHSKQGIAREVPQQSLCLALKPLRVYRKSSPYAIVKKEWEIKGVQRVAP